MVWKNYVFLDFRGGFGEASVSKASPNEEKSINQLSKNGEHYTDIEKTINEYEGKFTHLYFIPVSKTEQYVEDDIQ